jgi:hypothetical protein
VTDAEHPSTAPLSPSATARTAGVMNVGAAPERSSSIAKWIVAAVIMLLLAAALALVASVVSAASQFLASRGANENVGRTATLEATVQEEVAAPADAGDAALAAGGVEEIEQPELPRPGLVPDAAITVDHTGFEPFTDQQLQAWSIAELRGRILVLASARRRADLDAETSARIRTDFQRVVDELKKRVGG